VKKIKTLSTILLRIKEGTQLIVEVLVSGREQMKVRLQIRPALE
jgi:hypothetical protein